MNLQERYQGREMKFFPDFDSFREAIPEGAPRGQVSRYDYTIQNVSVISCSLEEDQTGNPSLINILLSIFRRKKVEETPHYRVFYRDSKGKVSSVKSLSDFNDFTGKKVDLTFFRTPENDCLIKLVESA